ncbi:MAG: hypothetical protein F6K62_25820 [Sphaerospermopsis sp. SIO1G2]|nr:hypothetical protein [Sphaerospermopsis sp. SIO1G2]
MFSIFKRQTPVILKTNDNGQVEYEMLKSDSSDYMFDDNTTMKLGHVSKMKLTLWNHQDSSTKPAPAQ